MQSHDVNDVQSTSAATNGDSAEMLDRSRDRQNGFDAAPAGAAVIEATNLSKWYGDVVAVSNVSFSIGTGVTGLLGPNGAGKSTILKMLTGLLAPSDGTVKVLGERLRSDVRLYRKIGLVPEQETIYPFLTGREFVRLNATLQKVPNRNEATERAIETVDMMAAADRAIGGYSKGMRQRIKVAAALVHDPAVLIMDEPLTGTDPLQRLQLIELIKQLGANGRTIVVSSHVLDEVERFAEQILVLVNGKLAAAGDFHAIRDKIDEHARKVRVRSDQSRALAAELVRLPWLESVQITGDSLMIETADVRALYLNLPRVARDARIRLYEIVALDDSLSSVFAYVTER